MSRVLAVIARMRELGISEDKILAVVETMEATPERARSSGAARQARYREREAAKKAQAVTRDVTRDVTESVTNVTPEAEPRARVVNTNLPSGDNNIPPIYPPAQTAPRKASRAKARTSISEDARPTDRDREEGRKVGMAGDVFDRQWRKFVDHHRAKGSLMADWAAAWRTWCGNFPSFGQPKPNVLPFATGSDPPPKPPRISDEEGRRIALEFERSRQMGRL